MLIREVKGACMTKPQSHELEAQMLRQYGPVIGGTSLYSALGFKSYAAFYRSMKRGEIGVPVFTLPSRRGWFALTSEVAAWLTGRRSENAQANSKQIQSEAQEEGI